MIHQTIKQLLNYAIFISLMIFMTSCDDSTSANTPVQTLKDNIYGKWKISRTCVLSNNDVKVGSKDTHYWEFSKSGINAEELIMTMGNYSITGYWAETELYKFKHWLLATEAIDPATQIKYVSLIEIGGFNPLSGLNTNAYEDPDTKELKLINAFEFTGVRN